MTRSLTLRLSGFLMVGMGILAICYFIVNSPAFSITDNWLALAITLDITLTIPFIYYLVIRRTEISKLTIIPLFILCIILAYQILPKEGEMYLSYIEYLLFPIEAFVAIFLIRKIISLQKEFRKQDRSLDFTETLRSTLEKKLNNKFIVSVLSTEISFIYYLFAGWKLAKRSLRENEFTYHIKSGYSAIFFTLLAVMLMEAIGLHFFLYNYFPVVAWILTILGIYFIFIIMGDYNAIRSRRVSLEEEYLAIKIGMRYEADIAYSEIESVEFSRKEIKEKDHAKFTTFGSANLLIHLKSEQEAIAVYGIRKKFRSFSIFIDDKEKFKQLLDGKTKMGQHA